MVLDPIRVPGLGTSTSFKYLGKTISKTAERDLNPPCKYIRCGNMIPLSWNLNQIAMIGGCDYLT